MDYTVITHRYVSSAQMCLEHPDYTAEAKPACQNADATMARTSRDPGVARQMIKFTQFFVSRERALL
jgi:hypothetical protein